MQLTESQTKLPIELVREKATEGNFLGEAKCSLRKAHEMEGPVKSQVRIYDKDKKHICSLFLELEKRGGRPVTPHAKKKQVAQIVKKITSYDF